MSADINTSIGKAMPKLININDLNILKRQIQTAK